MKRAPLAWLLVLALTAAVPAAQEPTLEYRVKAAYILNFIRYVEWPAAALGNGPIAVCVAGRNPFGTALDETVAGERIEGRAIAVRVILEPEAGCQVLVIPSGANAAAYLRSARTMPVLTIGESADFLGLGGIINLRVDGGSVRFDIDQSAAERVNLRISSRLLRLARPAPESGAT